MRDLGHSVHNVPIRELVYYGARLPSTSPHPYLNIPCLLWLLESTVAFNVIVEKGNKRTAPQYSGKKKRTKVNGGHFARDEVYPRLTRGPVLPPIVPVFRQQLVLSYSTANPRAASYDSEKDGSQPGYTDQETALIDALNGMAFGDIDLGTVSLVYSNGQVLGLVDGEDNSHEYLLHFPQDSEDLHTSAARLANTGRARFEASLKLIRIPTEDSEDLLPFRLALDVFFSLTADFADTLFDVIGKTKTLFNGASAEAVEKIVRFAYGYELEKTSLSIPYFYSVLRPAPRLPSQEDIQPEALSATLLPFQLRSVAWLLAREGKTIIDGQVVSIDNFAEYTFWKHIDDRGLSFYFNRLTGEISNDFIPCEPALGGILAEEPGLGKTLEIISLILLNPAPPERNPVDQVTWNEEASIDVKAIKTTLVITPPALASQWMDEIALHAPTLKVMRYDGWSKVPVPITTTQIDEERERRRKANKNNNNQQLDENNIEDWCSYVHGFDVVVTTYSDLNKDLNFARPVRKRPRRAEALYVEHDFPRSPLIMCEWQRVVMDEVQMVGGGSKTEEMVSLIPRMSSFAVSGTPARTKVHDLINALRFLRVDAVVGNLKAWEALTHNPGLFSEFIQHYTIRTVKANLDDELTIPQQTRFLVPIAMGRVERHVYDQAWEAVLVELDLDARGVSDNPDWEANPALLRASISRLRGICTHPQIGQPLLRNDPFVKTGAAKSMEDVLMVLKEQNWRSVMTDLRSYVQIMIRKAQLRQHQQNNAKCHLESLEILLEAERDCNELLKEIELEIAAHTARGEILKQTYAEGRNDVQPSVKGKEREITPTSSDLESDDGLPKNAAGQEHRKKRASLSNRLREARIVLHRIKFLQGDVYHVLGAKYSDEESAAYAFCEQMRHSLLKATADDANAGMAELVDGVTKQGIDEKTLRVDAPYLEQGGIRSAAMVDEFHNILKDVLNEQAQVLWEWRSEMHRLLTQKLVVDESEADGQEYQRSLDDQGEAEVYLQAYTALLADRRQALINERALLAAHDAREKRVRGTQAALHALAIDELDIDDAHKDIEFQPEHEALAKQLKEMRTDLLKDLKSRSVKSILVDMNAAYARIHKKSDPEKDLLKSNIEMIRQFMTDQGTALDKLDADLVLFRKAFNQRILYFRQLQEISDTVTQVSWEGLSYEAAVQECDGELSDLQNNLKTNRARRRYMENLQQDRHAAEEEDEECVLCRSEFEKGFITSCAHVFCEHCMKSWIVKQGGKVCPVCRVPIDSRNLQRFSVNGSAAEPEKSKPKPKPKVTERTSFSRRKIEYNMIAPETLEVIQNLTSYGDYGMKIQTLVQHLLYVQETDPGAKSIVFSAWADSLSIIERALGHNAIRCLRIDQSRGKEPATKKFKDDPDIQVLLLHGERENAGLNITCASRVFLLESVVKHAFEIQAIARIDRLGQEKATEVYCYYAEDTVEKNILDMAARQGLSLYTKENSAGTLNMSKLNVEDNKVAGQKSVKVKGDSVEKVDDMLAILFPHMFEDLEFLLPEGATSLDDGDVKMGDATEDLFGSEGLHA